MIASIFLLEQIFLILKIYSKVISLKLDLLIRRSYI